MKISVGRIKEIIQEEIEKITEQMSDQEIDEIWRGLNPEQKREALKNIIAPDPEQEEGGLGL
tara:strand:- start:494 stop:679 length:186 start_codon:yes stop_codon:yes gene_type:complete